MEEGEEGDLREVGEEEEEGEDEEGEEDAGEESGAEEGVQVGVCEEVSDSLKVVLVFCESGSFVGEFGACTYFEWIGAAAVG